MDNTIGATFQPNTWTTEWADFWDQHRLGHMLRLTDNVGLSDADAQKLRDKTKQLLAPSTEHTPLPSLLHGDLWGGNKGYCRETCIDETGNDGTEKVVPVIFDPATYYGDREADIAMTHLFGGFGSDFYEGYESEWPLDEVSTSVVGGSINADAWQGGRWILTNNILCCVGLERLTQCVLSLFFFFTHSPRTCSRDTSNDERSIIYITF